MPAECPNSPDSPAISDTRREVAIRRGRALAELSAAQHGVVSLAQLRGLGLGDRAVRERVACARLVRVHDAVYATGHAPLSRNGRWMAAVLACGPGAALCGHSAAAALGLIDHDRGPEVTSPERCGKARRAITVRQRSLLLPRDRTTVDGIPCTSVGRTLLDLAAVMHPQRLAEVCERAERREIFDLGVIRDLLGRCRGQRGVRRLRLAIEFVRPSEPAARSELERRFLALCARAGLRRPRVNAWIELPGGGLEADFSWPDENARRGSRRRRPPLGATCLRA